MSLPISAGLQVTANGTDVSNQIDWSSLDLILVLTKEVSTFQFNVRGSPTKTYLPALGDIIYVKETQNWGATATGTSTVIITGLTGTFYDGSPLNTTRLYIGMGVSGTNIPAGAYITAILSATSFSISSSTTGAISAINFVDIKFGGTITEIETVIEGGITPLAQVTATDWSYQMNGKLVVASYADIDPGQVVVDILENFCPAAFSVDLTYVQAAGYNISSIKFNYEQPTQCIEAVANQVGWNWYVDANKKVHFFLQESANAPFEIDDTSGAIEWNTLDVDENIQNMKNSVFVIGGTYESIFSPSTTPDIYLTNGTQMAWGLVYEYIPSSIAVTLNGVAQSVGIVNQEPIPADFQVMYDPSNKAITFTTLPGSGQTIVVFGTAEIPIIGHAQDNAAISEYGEFQEAIFDGNILSIAEAQQRALAEILLYGHAVYDVKFYTTTPGIRVGMEIIFNSSKFGVSNYPLIVKRIEGKGRRSNQLEYYIECVGSDQVTFVDVMAGLLTQENQNGSSQPDNTTLEALVQVGELLLATDTTTVTYTTGPYYVGTTAICGFSTCG